MQKRVFINQQIRASQVRLIDEMGAQLGVVSLAEALSQARAKNLDLIQVTGKVDPPVVRIEDYGKYLYQQKKKEREATKHGGSEVKEVRLGFNISDHDIETRIKTADRFFQKGHRVRLTLPLRGRQKAKHGEEYAREKIEQFLLKLGEKVAFKKEGMIKREGRGLSLILTKA